MTSEKRIFYMDNVRALAMLLGVFFHAAISYGPAIHEVWFVSDPSNSPVMDLGAWFSHMFRMPLFFIVAGFFAHLLIRKRGVGGFLKNRAIRILAPFVLFLPIILAAMLILMVYAANTIDAKSPLLELIADNINNPEAEPPPFGTAHLWFLYNLGWFCVVTVLCVRLKLNFISRTIDRIFSSPKHLLYLPLLLIPSLFVNAVPLPAPERIYPEPWSFGYFGLFFLFGWQLFRHPDYLAMITPYWKPMLGAGSLLYIGFFLLMPTISLADVLILPAGYDFSLKHMVQILLEAYSAVFLTLALLVLGKNYLNTRHAGLRYIADASYWIYIVHLPILFFVQIHLADVSISIWLKFLIASGITLITATISYDLLVRYTPIGRLLNGKKRRATSPSLLRILRHR